MDVCGCSERMMCLFPSRVTPPVMIVSPGPVGLATSFQKHPYNVEIVLLSLWEVKKPGNMVWTYTQNMGRSVESFATNDRNKWEFGCLSSENESEMVESTDCEKCSSSGLLNVARHTAFGKEAAHMVVRSFDGKWPEPWMPRPLISMHVRMGDKESEMTVVEFEEYMVLAGRIRKRFPQLKSFWLSTEMQEVIDQSQSYSHWEFYYTNVKRQVGNSSMAAYETSLGRETSTNYPIVNFLMASEADFFIGALGSSWCYLIDGMRTTGGKVMAGYLSVNKDRFL